MSPKQEIPIEANMTVMIMGSPDVGKSAFSTQFVDSYFTAHYDPSSADEYNKTYINAQGTFHVTILDTPNTEEFAALRKDNIIRSHVFIFIYSVTNEASLQQIAEYWDEVKEVRNSIPPTRSRHHNAQPTDFKPIAVLVGNKCDCPDHVKALSREDGEKVADKLGIKLFECSAKSRFYVEDIFDELITQSVSILPKIKKQESCNIM